MTPEAEKALRASISHWERVASTTTEDFGPEQCELCFQFRRFGCIGCPVAESMDLPFCMETPFDAVLDAFNEHGRASEEFRKKAEVELAFLKSLLAHEPPPKPKGME